MSAFSLWTKNYFKEVLFIMSYFFLLFSFLKLCNIQERTRIRILSERCQFYCFSQTRKHNMCTHHSIDGAENNLDVSLLEGYGPAKIESKGNSKLLLMVRLLSSIEQGVTPSLSLLPDSLWSRSLCLWVLEYIGCIPAERWDNSKGRVF